MNIIFAGTPDFAATALKALINSQHRVVAVYTQPDRPAGRGKKIEAPPVKVLALEHQLPVHQPLTLRDANEQKILADYHADIMVVAAYGLILPEAVLKMYRCLNIHASLLPRWRGASPIQHAILAGDKKTGITIMQMEQGLDTGPMLYKISCNILATDTAQTLHDKLAELGAEGILTVLNDLSGFAPEPQEDAGATYASKIKKDDARINWSLPAKNIERQIRAYCPWPIAFTEINKKIVRVWSAGVIKIPPSPPFSKGETIHEHLPLKKGGRGDFIAGEIIKASAEGIDVVAGEDIVRLLTIQLPGGKVLPVKDILNAYAKDFAPGNVFL